MKERTSQSDVERFKAAITRRIGLQFDDAKLDLLAEVLRRRAAARRLPASAYLTDLEQQQHSGAEIAALAQGLTVGETYFFRNIEQFHALAKIVLPQRMRVPRTPKVLRLLSAGCASGEEAYTMAMVAREAVADASWGIVIDAVDINAAALQKAASGRYSSWALRDTPAEVQRKWFRAAGRDMILDATVRAAVNFGAANLASGEDAMWYPARYDAIFCRNVLMYFAPEQIRTVVARIAHSLAPGGFLFLGHAETLRGLSDQFELRHSHATFYYQKSGREAPVWTPASNAIASNPMAAPIAAFDDGWANSIRQATERVAALVPSSIAEAPPLRPAAARWDPAPALDLLRSERFVEALDYVRAAPRGGSDPDVLLLEAALLSHSGQHDAAEKRCSQLLAIDGLNAGANYVLALCREHSGDRDAAAEFDRVAAYLDPTFAMPRLHLGLMARRTGDREWARREFAQALVLLKGEEASRLLLFGGGFSRDGLIALCESSLTEHGGR